MNTEPDRDWQQLARDWQTDEESPSAADIPADIRRRVQRFSLGLYALTVVEVVGLSVALFYFTRSAWIDPGPLEITTAATLWILGSVAMGFALWNRRGTWRPSARTTRAFVELSRERCLRRLRSVRFAWWLLAAEFLLFVPWIAWVIASKPEKLARAPEIYFTTYGFLAAMVLGASLALWWLRRTTARELAEVEELRRSLAE